MHPVTSESSIDPRSASIVNRKQMQEDDSQLRSTLRARGSLAVLAADTIHHAVALSIFMSDKTLDANLSTQAGLGSLMQPARET